MCGVRASADLKPIEDRLNADAASPSVPDTKVAVTSTPAFPPLPTNPATDALAKRAQAIYAGLARPLLTGGNGGASGVGAGLRRRYAGAGRAGTRRRRVPQRARVP